MELEEEQSFTIIPLAPSVYEGKITNLSVPTGVVVGKKGKIRMQMRNVGVPTSYFFLQLLIDDAVVSTSAVEHLRAGQAKWWNAYFVMPNHSIAAKIRLYSQRTRTG